MSHDLLSIVVPVYNVAPYLDRSIQSILGQTYRKLEIILVDDGSTDESGKICKKYAELDSRVKVLSQKNQGASAARRNGVRLASGAYMGFIDPDDYIDPDFYEQLMACRGEFDMVISQWLRESESGTRRCHDTFPPGAYETSEDMEFLLRHLINISLPGGAVNIRPGIAAYLWNKLFRTELVKEAVDEIKVDLAVSNDRPIIYGVMLKCRSVLFTEVCGYHYQVREGSIAHGVDKNCRHLRSTCEFYDLMEAMLEGDPRRRFLLPQVQLKTAEDITRAPARMGFPEEAQLQLKTPVFPFINLLDGKQIALYGAGLLGNGYRRQILKWNICQLVLWVDEDWEEYARTGLGVDPVEDLLDAEYDCIVLAVSDQASADSIRQKLISTGIENDRILWRAPLEM